MKDLIFWLSLLAAFGLYALFVIRQSKRASAKRRQMLRDVPKIDLDSLPEKNAPDACVVLTNFGFGSEAWYLPSGDQTIDHSKMVFAHGRLIEPPPAFRKFSQWCKDRGIRLDTVALKRNVSNNRDN